MSGFGFKDASILKGLSVKFAGGSRAPRYEPPQPKRHEAEQAVEDDSVQPGDLREVDEKLKIEQYPTQDIGL